MKRFLAWDWERHRPGRAEDPAVDEFTAPDEWRCPECGESPTIDQRWRWLDGRPEHHHGYPVGHLPAERVE
jgi:hypothetical protein